ncbi:MATE family efflux transporter [Rhodoferax sp. TBRC 17660]|uniref:MATE family efflux transporter n=1 Tax=Rhodoferax potami TaxID=3068338 RepID=A0ABU3KMW8_9BURK|nr:MATE family efflux transporter [Rhodoferax sp. TBRC 17660]MDT7518597.1 MATE family efflux transporter [Rhodoferax sp. TBRC 17660]
MSTPERLRLNTIAGPLLGEFLLGMTVAMGGLWLASHESDAAAGAFGLVNQILETLSVAFRVLAIGLGVMVTQYVGGGQHAAARRVALLALGASSWVGAAIMLVVVAGNDVMLDWLNAPAMVASLAAPYLQWFAPALLLDAYNLSMAAVLRAHLFAKDSLRIMIAMHGTHLALAFVIMRGWGSWDGMGLEGYAIAMLVSRALGLVLHLWFWRVRMQLTPYRQDWWRFAWVDFAPVLRVGLPGAGVEVTYRAAFMVSLAATARLGVTALATHSYTLQLLKYVLLTSMAIGWACEIMVGRLVGAGDLRAANGLVRKAVRNGLLASGSLALFAALGAPWLMRAFTKDAAVIEAAQTLLWLSLLLETGRVFNLILNGALRATGDAIYPAVSSVASLVLVLGVGSFWLGRLFGLPGIWLAYALDEWIRGLLLLSRWLWRGWLPNARNSRRRLRAEKN